MREDLDPGTFVIVDQFIDRTINRKKTFFENGIVAHVPMAEPTNKTLMNISKEILESLNIKNSFGGTYIAMEGPQFSSKAESLLYRSWNCDVIGMTNMPEAKLAREAEIRYASISMVTDFDSWSSEHEDVDLQMLLETKGKNVEKSKKFILNFSNKYFSNLDFSNDNTSTILNTSIVTQYEHWNREIEVKLANILKRFKQDPLLLTHPKEIIEFFKKCDKNVGLLLDVGHLKVSAKTYGFNLFKAHEMLKPYIEGYHLSDNDGLKDSNSEFTKKSWFYNKLKRNVKYISIEVYSKNFKKLKSLQYLIKKKYDKYH